MSHTRRNGKESEPKCYEFVFDGGLESSVRAGLLIELIKYILYERQQIPAPYEWIVSELKQFTENMEKHDKTDKDPRSDKNPSVNRIQLRRNALRMKRAIKAISNLQQMFKEISAVFEQCPEIKQVMLVLGSTTISPKESYLINLPPTDPEADNLALKNCTRSLFRQLIMQDFLNGAKSISPTSLAVLVTAPRTMEMSWFLPNKSFKSPLRGEKFVFDFVNNVGSHDQSVTGSHEIDMSGIEPLESSVIDFTIINQAGHQLDLTNISSSSMTSEENDTTQSLLRPLSDSELSSKTSSSSLNSSSVSSGCKYDSMSSRGSESLQARDCSHNGIHLENEEEQVYMWFQAPIRFKGYKCKQK